VASSIRANLPARPAGADGRVVVVVGRPADERTVPGRPVPYPPRATRPAPAARIAAPHP
jgi:hypothetical protein